MARDRQITFRLDEPAAVRLDQRAAATGVRASSLAARYVDEGLRMDAHPLIAFRDSEMGRRAILQGSRLSVADVIATVRQNGGDAAVAGAYLSVARAKVEACVAYYAEFTAEVDDLIVRAKADADSAEASWRRAQALRAS